MAYANMGTQTMFPVYLARLTESGQRRDEYDTAVAQNENNLNQNFAILYAKLAELEAYLAAPGA